MFGTAYCVLGLLLYILDLSLCVVILFAVSYFHVLTLYLPSTYIIRKKGHFNRCH